MSTYPITILSFCYNNDTKRTYSHNDGLPENFGVLLKRQLCKYKDIKKLRKAFDEIELINPYVDTLSNEMVDEMISKKYIDYNKLLSNAQKLGVVITDEIKTNWFNVLDQWVGLGIKPYIEYTHPYMIDYDEIEGYITDAINFEYIIDLDSKDLIICGMSETAFSFEELYDMQDEEFIDIIYYNENNVIFKDSNI